MITLLGLHLPVLSLLATGLPVRSGDTLAELPGPTGVRVEESWKERSDLEIARWKWSARQQISRREYSYGPLEHGWTSAPNRAQGLRSRVGPEGIDVSPRDAAAGKWKLSILTVGFGYGSDLDPIVVTHVSSRENRAERFAGVLSEWYVNEERGIEHGWTVHVPPKNPARRLRIELQCAGLLPVVAREGDSARFMDGGGEVRLNYREPHSWDAAGQDLSTRLVRTPGGLAVLVEVEGAQYPITVDPLLTGPVWTAEGDQGDERFGWSVSSAGDVNGDGYADLIVGADAFDNGETDEGGAFLYLGSPAGPSLAPDWMAEGDQPHARFGSSVAGGGDVNGDGFDDIVVGARFFDNGESNEGRVYLYLGSASGPSLTPDWTAESNDSGALFGWSVSSAGDVDADGFDDVLIGAHFFGNGEAEEGGAFLYLGSPTGPSLAPDWMVESNQSFARFGSSVSLTGDVNGDGFDDVLVGSMDYTNGEPAEGRAFLYLGSTAGPSATPSWVAESDQANAQFGWSVSVVGDVNGDGFDDVLIGSDIFDNGAIDEGRAFLYLGSAGGPSLTSDWTAEGDQASAQFGNCVSGAGDVNGDGFDDVVVGAPTMDTAFANDGKVYLFLGSAGGPSLVADWTAVGQHGGASLGRSAAGAGDVNGDGLDDVVIGAFGVHVSLGGEGQALLFLGAKISDCNGNGVDDSEDITNGTSEDCNANEIPDECDLASGTSEDANQNGVPDECDSLGALYCIGAPNSWSPEGARIFAVGSAVVGDDDFALVTYRVPNQVGVYYYGPTSIQIPFNDGFRCVGGTTIRVNPPGSAVNHVMTRTLDLAAAPHSGNIVAGSTWKFQLWYRDPGAGGAGSNLSNAVSITFQ